MEVKRLQIWIHTRSKFRTTKLQIQGERKSISLVWTKSETSYPQYKSLSSYFNKLGLLTKSIWTWARFLNRFSYWIWSWRRQVRESRRWIYFWMMRQDERFSKTCNSFRLFKKQCNDGSVGKKILLKVLNCLLLH